MIPVDAPAWFVFVSDIALLGFVLFGILFAWAWKNARMCKGKMIAELWEPTGFPVRYFVKADITGKTVEVDGGTYRLQEDRDDSKEKSHSRSYPSKRYIKYPQTAFLGIGALQNTVRIESWERDNPEPIRPPGTPPIVTASEWSASKKEIQAISVAADVQESAEREKAMRSAIANQPNKMIVYALSGLASVAAIAVLIYLATLAPYMTGG